MEKLDMNALRTNAKEFADSVRTYKDDARDHAELLLQKLKLQEYIQEKKEDERLKKTILTVLAIIGIVNAAKGQAKELPIIGGISTRVSLPYSLVTASRAMRLSCSLSLITGSVM